MICLFFILRRKNILNRQMFYMQLIIKLSTLKPMTQMGYNREPYYEKNNNIIHDIVACNSNHFLRQRRRL